MTEPAGISAMITRPASGASVGGCRWLPGMRRVAPFSAVKSSSAHIVLSTTGRCGQPSGYTLSSRCSPWATSPGPMSIATGALELARAEHGVDDPGHEGIRRGSVEPSDLCEECVDPAGAEALEVVAALRRRGQHRRELIS